MVPASNTLYSQVTAWRISQFTGIDQLHKVTASIDPPKRKQVAVKIHAVSLNYRELLVGMQPVDCAVQDMTVQYSRTDIGQVSNQLTQCNLYI